MSKAKQAMTSDLTPSAAPNNIDERQNSGNSGNHGRIHVDVAERREGVDEFGHFKRPVNVLIDNGQDINSKEYGYPHGGVIDRTTQVTPAPAVRPSPTQPLPWRQSSGRCGRAQDGVGDAQKDFTTYGSRMLQARGGEEDGASGQAGQGKTEQGGEDNWIGREEPPRTSTAIVGEDRDRGSIDTLLSSATTDEIYEDGNEEIAIDGVQSTLSYSSPAALTNGHGTKGPESRQGAVLSPMMAVLQGATIVRESSGVLAGRQNLFVKSNEVLNTQGKSGTGKRQIKAQHLLPPNPPNAQDQALMHSNAFLRAQSMMNMMSTAAGEATRVGDLKGGPFGGTSGSILKSRDQSSKSAVRRM